MKGLQGISHGDAKRVLEKEAERSVQYPAEVEVTPSLLPDTLRFPGRRRFHGQSIPFFVKIA
jgi:hypothetical protein